MRSLLAPACDVHELLIHIFGSACNILNASAATQKFICNLITEFSGGNGSIQVQKPTYKTHISLISNEILINLPSYFHYCMMSVSEVQQRGPNCQR